MGKCFVIRKRTARLGCALALVASIAAMALWLWLPQPGRRETADMVETSSRNELFADGKVVAYFCCVADDSTFSALSLHRDSVSVGARIVWRKGQLRRAVSRTRLKLERRLAYLEDVEKEVNYHLGIHNVQDEGFEMVTSCSATLHSMIAECRALLDALCAITPQTTVGVRRIASREPIADIVPSEVSVDAFGRTWRYGRPARALRSGPGVVVTDTGGVVCGQWRGDTVVAGRIVNGEEVYDGQLDGRFLPSGHGRFITADGRYYEGGWHGGKRSGYGIAVEKRQFRAGQWSDDRFLGEKMHYTSERVYGIDISQYQHLKGRKSLPIRWDRLRIKSLGSISRKTVHGAVDYPVSFVYIKSTEGTTIRNPYFKADHAQARRHNVRVGAYHFFSVRSAAAMQADHFLRSTTFSSGDLPPVLDVEPTDRQIAQMGGAKALFAAVRTWMAIVRRRVGVRPVLYVSQRFVNKYLPLAPDINRDYKIWIARYGEYKPGVRLVYWQLCPDGGVNGISGEVDINVFNGYRDKFNEFVANETIR